MEIYTEGKSLSDAIEMARDTIGLKGMSYEDDGIDYPKPSSQEDCISKAKEDTEIFDFSRGILTYGYLPLFYTIKPCLVK